MTVCVGDLVTSAWGGGMDLYDSLDDEGDDRQDAGRLSLGFVVAVALDSSGFIMAYVFPSNPVRPGWVYVGACRVVSRIGGSVEAT